MLAVLLTASACATTQSPDTSSETPRVLPSSKPSDAANLIGSSALGAMVALPQNNALGVSNVIVESEYHAASGRACRRLLSGSGQTIERVACNQGGDNWQFSRDLRSRSSVKTTFKSLMTSEVIAIDSSTVAPQTAVMLESSTDDADIITFEEPLLPSTPFSVLQNETLWAFSKRTTGNALNWTRIAQRNDIQNTNAIRAGAVLLVPDALVSSGE